MAVAAITATIICATGAAFAAFAVCAVPDGGNNGGKDEEGHVLVKLWKEYKEAEKADLPKKQEEILKEIMDQSVKQNLAWDYCCAATRWHNVASRRDWKRGEETRNTIRQTVSELDIPILSYTLPEISFGVVDDVDIKWFEDNVVARAGELRKSRNDGFYSRLERRLYPFLTDYISNDYEYILWSAAWVERDDDEITALAKKLLDVEIAGKYPQEPYKEYLELLYDDSEDAAFKQYSEKYSGRAIALFAEQHVLIERLSDLNGKEDATPEEYLAIRKACEEFIATRKTFKGEEAKIAGCAKEFERMVEYLDAQNIRLKAKDGVVSILLQNVKSVELEIKDVTDSGKVKIDNPVCSYFCEDTVEYKIPDCPDGTYEIVCTSGDIKESIEYEMYSISLAYRKIDTGLGVYVADYLTGRPIENADLEIAQKGTVVHRISNINFNGFTSIESLISGVDKKKRFTLKCSLVDGNGMYRCSEEVSLYLDSDGEYKPEVDLSGRIFMDRAAFNPGDTLQFKAVAYSSVDGKNLTLFEEGRELTARLKDPDRNIVESIELRTNEFGSASGSFAIPMGIKGGSYSLELMAGSEIIATSRLTVDEFVLPTFELKFDKTDEAYFSGETVSVKGKLTSYSGHGLGSAKLEYVVRSYVNGEEKVVSGGLTAASDGRFEVNFKADESEHQIYYHLTVKATELTGETGEWSKSIRVNPSSSIGVELSGTAEGKAETTLEEKVKPAIVLADSLELKFGVHIYALEVKPEIEVNYRLVTAVGAGETVLEGTAVSGVPTELSLSGLASGLYRLEFGAKYVNGSGHEIKMEASKLILKTSDSDKTVPQGVKYYYKKLENGRIAVQLATSEEERWFVVEVYSAEKQLLRSEILHLGPEAAMIDYEFEESYTDVVQIAIFSFRDSQSQSQTYVYERGERPEDQLPLEFTTFTANSLPNGECQFVLQTAPGVEAVVSVFDKSTERIRGNSWSKIWRRMNRMSRVGISAYSGSRESASYFGGITPFYPQVQEFDDGLVMDMALPMRRSASRYEASLDSKMLSRASNNVAEDVSEEVVMADAAESEEVSVREQFDNTIAFLPFLRSDSDGRISFTVTPTDKLSTYYVSVFAHDKELRTSVLRKEMVVSVPVKIAVVEPQFLFEGDVYKVRATVSNVYNGDFEGVVRMELYDGNYRDGLLLKADSAPLTVKAEAAGMTEFEVEVPAGVAELGLKLTYVGENASGKVSDAVFVTVPVHKPVQTLTEAHSKLLTGGEDIEAVKSELAGLFAGASAEDLEYHEISLLEMILEAIPEKVGSEEKDVISMSEAFYAGRLAEYLATRREAGESVEVQPVAEAAGLLAKILNCQNADGGFGWYEGFGSSQIVTAMVLERFAGLRDRKLLTSEWSAKLDGPLTKAVKYLDNKRFEEEYPRWCGWLSLSQYMHVRTRYPEVEFAPASSSSDKYQKILSRFKKSVQEYLLPEDARGLTGDILGKARRVDVLLALSASGSSDLASAWGIKSASKLRKSADADMQSLAEYAVEHSSGGVYYPNAVMPFRGLLESEAYAHSLLCDLNERWYREGHDAEYHRIAEGIRLWLMVQKESQKWDSDPGYMDALSSVLDGFDEVLGSKVAVMSGQYSAPLEEIKSAGNGFTIERKFFVERSGVRTEIGEGESVNVGDKIVAEYRIWSEENRSFVRMDTPRYAALRPVRQVSGMAGGLFRRLTPVSDRIFYFAPSTYMEIKADRTVWSFDVCPEETTVLTEEFYITQAGVFASPAVSIESLYAPHYRANDSAPTRLSVEF